MANMAIKTSPYKHYKVIRKYFRKDRLYIQVEKQDNKTEALPHANYNWLIGNPSFPGIPKGYIIHHLDNDPLNDDISNLALMYKNHHRAYHLKYKNSDIPVELNSETDNASSVTTWPIKRPKAYYERDRNKWRIYYATRDDDKRREHVIGKYKGKYFLTEQEAENAIDKLWPDFNSSHV